MADILLSAALPGVGHHRQGLARWIGYAAVEAAGWALLSESRRQGDSLRRSYRDLAWRVPRGRPDPRRDGDFGYYEELLAFEASGALDADPGRPGVQPEVDPDTHNGAIWALATEIFFPPGQPPPEGSPEYQRALEYYLRRGIPAELAWDWQGNEEARRAFGRILRNSDEEVRRSVTMAGLLLANRVLSAVDLFVASRWNDAPLPVLRFVPGGAREGAWLLVRIPLP